MSLLDVFGATVIASVWLSWMALLISCIPAVVTFASAPRIRRWHYVIAILSGGFAGEFCGVGCLFLNLWMYCQGIGQSCNTAQGDMGLIFTAPGGAFLGTLFAIGWTWATLRIPSTSPWCSVGRYSGPNRLLHWICVIAVPIGFWIFVTCLCARLMS
jgi:hypothetical protein